MQLTTSYFKDSMSLVLGFTEDFVSRRQYYYGVFRTKKFETYTEMNIIVRSHSSLIFGCSRLEQGSRKLPHANLQIWLTWMSRSFFNAHSRLRDGGNKLVNGQDHVHGAAASAIIEVLFYGGEGSPET